LNLTEERNLKKKEENKLLSSNLNAKKEKKRKKNLRGLQKDALERPTSVN
jgi:hypothetical protein